MAKSRGRIAQQKYIFKPLSISNRMTGYKFFMAEFAYNNIKYINIGHMNFQFNCKYYLCVFYKKTLIFVQNQKP